MSGNSLQAMLDRAKASPELKEAPTSRRRAITVEAADNQTKPTHKPSRASTKLIGGHFSPDVSTQLRIIAAEEGSTIQSLLAEALNDLFVKKGKARIEKI